MYKVVHGPRIPTRRPLRGPGAALPAIGLPGLPIATSSVYIHFWMVHGWGDVPSDLITHPRCIAVMGHRPASR
ncbi:hypothetical protein BT67DRAFT_310896 [Trichocladium antarcticum]|uniref:Uncharacterized protein n=1 Tax=Trichocladium antarcticum TaxID=1450529 RepID=A0AAN6UJK0_9PEZI|nr:hypothetical protein BT67DRAFT_310896 [Trichocladium antarcticum]